MLVSLANLVTVMTVFAFSQPVDVEGWAVIACGQIDHLVPVDLVMSATAIAIGTVIMSAVACLSVLRVIANRPPATAGPGSEALDTARRKITSATVFYAWSCLLASSLWTVSALAVGLFGNLDGYCTDWWLAPLRVSVTLTMATGGAAFVYLLAKLTQQSRNQLVPA
ncbi:hypothetical protein ACWGII_09260 [Streptomyces sp. NPDC054855]